MKKLFSILTIIAVPLLFSSEYRVHLVPKKKELIVIFSHKQMNDSRCNYFTLNNSDYSQLIHLSQTNFHAYKEMIEQKLKDHIEFTLMEEKMKKSEEQLRQKIQKIKEYVDQKVNDSNEEAQRWIQTKKEFFKKDDE